MTFNLEKQRLRIDVFNLDRRSYFAVALGNTMINTDMVWFSGMGNVFDMWSKGYGRPRPDKQQDWDLVLANEENRKWSFTAERKMSTGDD